MFNRLTILFQCHTWHVLTRLHYIFYYINLLHLFCSEKRDIYEFSSVIDIPIRQQCHLISLLIFMFICLINCEKYFFSSYCFEQSITIYKHKI